MIGSGRHVFVGAALLAALVICICFAGIAAQAGSKASFPQAAGPKVSKINIVGLRKALRPKGRPLLVNFWATWCEPCREEFPDLVKINADYKGRIDTITISIDELSEIDRDVPKFLAEMKATMPTFLLHTRDEDAAIKLVAPNWAGSLPMTIIYDSKGAKVYTRMGKIKPEMVAAELDKLLAPVVTSAPLSLLNST